MANNSLRRHYHTVGSKLIFIVSAMETELLIVVIVMKVKTTLHHTNNDDYG